MNPWPRALPRRIPVHALRLTTLAELLRAGVALHRLLLRSDVRVTTGTYAHLVVVDLRAAMAKLPVARPALPGAPRPAGSCPRPPRPKNFGP